jgi:hypothetical protein
MAQLTSLSGHNVAVVVAGEFAGEFIAVPYFCTRGGLVPKSIAFIDPSPNN